MTWKRQLGVAALLLGVAVRPVAAVPQPSAADLLATLEPAVVNLSITRHTQIGGASDIAAQHGVSEQNIQASGFIIDPAGIIVTNRHVLANATDVLVTLNDTTRLRASVVALSTHSDIALLKVRAGRKLPAEHLGSSSQLRPGEPVWVVGNPLGLGSTVTAGIVSALDRVIPESDAGSFFQVDAPINPGNSGGPVFNMAGDVVGISTALVSASHESGSVGLGLCIPSDDARIIITSLEKTGHDTLGSIGIGVQGVTEDIAAASGLPQPTAAIVTHVAANGAAAKAGLESGDIILTVGNEKVVSPQMLNRALVASPVGTPVELGIWRDGKRRSILATVEALPDDEKTPMPKLERGPGRTGDKLGFALGPLTGDARARLGMSPDDTGALIEDVHPESVASDHGIVAGSVLVKVDRKTISSPPDGERSFEEATAAGRGSVLVLVRDPAGFRWLALGLTPVPITR